MGLCASALEVSVEDLRPYGFIPRMWHSYQHMRDILALRRHMRSAIVVVRRLSLDKIECSKRLRDIQFDIKRCDQLAGDHRKGDQMVLYRAAEAEKRRHLRDAARILAMISVMNHCINQVSEEAISSDLMVTLEYYTQMPFLRYDGHRWSEIVANLARRNALTDEQAERFQELLSDITLEAEVERDLAPIEKEELATAEISAAPDVPVEELIALANAGAAERL